MTESNPQTKKAFIFIKISIDISNIDHFVSIHISYQKKKKKKKKKKKNDQYPALLHWSVGVN